jgi:pimeloyl-ACP methyl ester carboxylesterase
MKRPSVHKNERWRQRHIEAYDAVLRAWPVVHESHHVATRFGLTHVISSGPADGPPLVLLPGAGVTATMWRPNVAALSADRRVHAVDTLWDLGKGEPEVFPTSYAGAAEWFRDLLDGLGHRQVDLVGLSYGGFLAARFAIDAPKRIRRLVIMAPAATLSDLSGKFVINALALVVVPTRPRFICKAITRWTAATPIPDDLLEQWVVGVRGVRIPAPMHKIPPLVLTDDELRSVRAPALLIMGEKEWTCRDPMGGVERFRRLVPGAEAEVVEGAGHIVSMDRPELVSTRILAHLGTPRSS